MRKTAFWILITCCSTVATYAQTARVSSQTGTAEVMRNNQWMPLVPGDSINSGEKVRTGSDSTAAIMMSSGQVLTLSSNSEIQLVDTNRRTYTAGGRALMPVAPSACQNFYISPYVVEPVR
jgi:hypothetical protein